MGSRAMRALSGAFALSVSLAFLPAPADAATPSVSSWQQAIHALPVSGKGCFAATYPVISWQVVSCQTAPEVPFGPGTSSTEPSAVGDGVDYSAVASGGPLRSVTGSFPSVTAGTTEKGRVPVASRPKLANTFSLQLNSSFFPGAPACSGAAKPKKCLGWQQFVLATSPYSGDPPELFMQYWLIRYGATCPGGWFSFGKDCYENSDATSTPVLTASELSSVSLKGSATAGGSDKAILSTRTTDYAVTNSDSILDLSANWAAAEFGVFGDGDGLQAIFSHDTTIQVMTATDDGTALAPSCEEAGFTGETNNLDLVKTPARDKGSTPAIASEQSNTLLSSASCVSSS